MSSSPETLFVLGCSRLGSTLTPLNRAQSLAFIRGAFELGVRNFDTASIYGQGDSERLLGEALAAVRGEVSIATKAGQRLTPRQRLLRPLKPLVRYLVRGQSGRSASPAVSAPSPTSSASVRSASAAAGLVAQQRARGVDYCFEPDYLLKSLQGSLRRLRSSSVEIFYLHSPPPSALAQPALWRALQASQRAGDFVKLGVSCDDLDTAEAALACPAVGVLQFEPDDSARSAAVLALAADRAVHVYARLGARRKANAAAALRSVLAAPAVRAVLMGTTRAEHLAENLQAYAAALADVKDTRL
jgi:aryl-alcohol dehydrogenase-like predicted oxidoreductase